MTLTALLDRIDAMHGPVTAHQARTGQLGAARDAIIRDIRHAPSPRYRALAEQHLAAIRDLG